MVALFAGPQGPNVVMGMPPVSRTDQHGTEVAGRMPGGPHLLGPDGRFSVGSLGVLVDDVLGWSLLASLPDESWTVSTEIWLDVLAPLPVDARALSASARTLQTGSYSAGSVTDDDGTVLAAIRERGRRIQQNLSDLVVADASDPAAPAGKAADVMDLLGLVPLASDTVRLTMTPAHDNPREMLHGGLSFAGSEIAATWSRVQAGSALVTSSVHIVHARGIPSGSVVDFEVTTRHAGRGLWVSDVAGVVDGRTATLTRVVAEPGFPAGTVPAGVEGSTGR